MNRHRELIERAIETLENGESPLGRDFLRENDVTLDEAFDLADAMASGLGMIIAFADMPEPQPLYEVTPFEYVD